MARVNTCLRWMFVIFNVLFAIIGGLIIMSTLMVQFSTYFDGDENLLGQTRSYLLLYVVGAVIMVVSIVGAHGACKESTGCMIAFLVCMVTGTLLMLRAGIFVAVLHPEVEGTLNNSFAKFVPLDTAPDSIKERMDYMQSQLHCCGLFSYTDWKDDIPSSCECSSVEEGLCQTVNYRDVFMERKSVYSQSCLPIIIHYALVFFDILTGIIFTLAGLALLGTILSSIIIHQIRHPRAHTVVLKVPTVFTTSSPKYQQLQTPPPNYC
ncbi:hypothetical protein Q5P01_003840 [Channa striata]|uniref:Tetraspanin n=1 Tax=Channa striata TaxID=64152 RepID=A0AA88NT89_CHASR|nr:hypothetical protein Q5P01_003840 [Channa striata]